MAQHTARALQPFGTTIFAEISQLAAASGAINLGQGFPDFEGPDEVKHAAAKALFDHPNQYAPLPGIPALRGAIADSWRNESGLEAQQDTQITVTCGATEGIAAALLGLLNPGDEVVLFEPFYDSYRAIIALAGAVPRFVTLRPDDEGRFVFDPADLDRAITRRTRAILLNTPHNPTGKVFTPQEHAEIADRCTRHDLVAIADEVYHRLTYDGIPHTPIATLPGMAERTITLNSIGKTYSLTGWKIGWAIAPPDLSKALRSAHQFLTYAIATPLQHASAAALRLGPDYLSQLRTDYTHRRDALAPALLELGFRFKLPSSGYFLYADHSAVSGRLGLTNDVELCKHLIESVGVATIPPSVFYSDPKDGAGFLRFAFCKRVETIHAAVDRLKAGLG